MAWVGVVALVLHLLGKHKASGWLKWPALITGGLQATLAAWFIVSGQEDTAGQLRAPPVVILGLGGLGVLAFFLISKEQDRKREQAGD